MARKISRGRGNGSLWQNIICWTWQVPWTHNLTAASTARIRPVWDQANPSPSIEGRDAQEVLPLAEKLLIIDNFWVCVCEGGVLSSQEVTCGPTGGPMPKNTEAALNGLSGLMIIIIMVMMIIVVIIKRRWREGVAEREMEWRERDRWVNLIKTHYVCVWNRR